MKGFFEGINQMIKDAEFAGVLVIILIISLVVLNIVACVCIISARKSLKRIADNCDSEKKPAEDKSKK